LVTGTAADTAFNWSADAENADAENAGAEYAAASCARA
jgi:hypothetical protein